MRRRGFLASVAAAVATIPLAIGVSAQANGMGDGTAATLKGRAAELDAEERLMQYREPILPRRPGYLYMAAPAWPRQTLQPRDAHGRFVKRSA
jgi:hypothetical protein